VRTTTRTNKKKGSSIRSFYVIYTIIALCILSIALVGCGSNNSDSMPIATTTPTKETPTRTQNPTSTFTPTPLVIDGTRIDLDLGEFYIRSNKSSEISGEITFVA
ncbi:uncharacterized protein METZ01_LOCUS100849, partial [marine metagenome]